MIQSSVATRGADDLTTALRRAMPGCGSRERFDGNDTAPDLGEHGSRMPPASTGKPPARRASADGLAGHPDLVIASSMR